MDEITENQKFDSFLKLIEEQVEILELLKNRLDLVQEQIDSLKSQIKEKCDNCDCK